MDRSSDNAPRGIAMPSVFWTPFVSALNHVVAQQPQLGERLRAHAGKTVRVVFGASTLATRVDLRAGEQGELSVSSTDVPDATMTIRPSIDAAFDLVRSGRGGMTSHVVLDGDPLLGGAMAELMRDVRWDYEEDLSRFIGDAAAHRLGTSIRSAGEMFSRFGQRLTATAARHATEPQGPLVSTREVADHERNLRELASRVDALERRG